MIRDYWATPEAVGAPVIDPSSYDRDIHRDDLRGHCGPDHLCVTFPHFSTAADHAHDPRLLSPEEIAERVGRLEAREAARVYADHPPEGFARLRDIPARLGRNAIKKAVGRGAIEAVMVGGAYYCRPEDVVRYCSECHRGRR